VGHLTLVCDLDAFSDLAITQARTGANDQKGIRSECSDREVTVAADDTTPTRLGGQRASLVVRV
jgi:hypothetical protein